MQVMLMRHADAEPMDAKHYPDDDQRPLTKRGCDIHEKVTSVLKHMGIAPTQIITSPRLRALQTAGITAKGLNLVEKLTLSRALGQGYSLEAVLEMLGVFNPDDTILCVGHDPDLCELAAALLGITESSSIKFPKSGVMGIEFHGSPAAGAGVLHFFYRPEDLVALL